MKDLAHTNACVVLLFEELRNCHYILFDYSPVLAAKKTFMTIPLILQRTTTKASVWSISFTIQAKARAGQLRYSVTWTGCGCCTVKDLAYADACVVVFFEELDNSRENLFIILFVFHLWDGCEVTPRLPEVSLQVIHMGGIRSEMILSIEDIFRIRHQVMTTIGL